MERYLTRAILLSFFVSFLMPSMVSGEQLQPEDLTYQGAFRLPDDFNWGARGLSYYPPGNSGAGSLLVTGFEALTDGYAEYGEISIPTPQQEANWQDLPSATLLRPMTAFDGGLIQPQVEYVFVSGIQYVPRQGSQTSDNIYGSLTAWYPEGEFGDASFPTVWFSALNGSSARGLFYVGPQPQTAPYHGRKVGGYLFTVPEWYADLYLGGRTLITGRSRGTPVGSDSVTTAGGSQGPTLFAFHPFNSDTPTGNLDALPVLYYRVKFPGCAGPNVGDPSQCDYPDFTMCDSWTGGAFVENGNRQAILLQGYKGLGTNCYDEPPVECNDPCSNAHGYHCHPYERQVIFYDVHVLGQNVSSSEPWNVLPYTIWRPEAFYLKADAQRNVCGDVGGMAVDQAGQRLFMVERGLGEGDINAAVVHVWTFGDSSCPSCSGDAVTLQNVAFPTGRTCQCIAASITIGPGVIIPSGAIVEFVATSSVTVGTAVFTIPSGAAVVFTTPTVTIRSGVTIENGAVVQIR